MREQRKWRENWMLLCLGVLLFCTSGAWADFTFGEPVNLGPKINTPSFENPAYGFSDDGLSLAFVRLSSGADYLELWFTTRPTSDSPWGTPENHGIVNDLETAFIRPDMRPCFTELISPDGLEAYFDSWRPGGYGGGDIWMMSRATPESDWEQPINLGPTVNSTHDESEIILSPDGLELYFCDDYHTPRSGGYGSMDIWVTRRDAIGAPWKNPVNLGPNVNSDRVDRAPYLSHDGLLLLFSSSRSSGYGSFDLYVSRRASLSDPWEPAVSLGPTVNSPRFDYIPQLSADGSTLYLSSNRSGGFGNMDVWEAPVIPIVDFNGDGLVDYNDVTILMDRWGTDDPLCDIGPMPWGDGVVDEHDLLVLAESIVQDIVDPTLVAHWALDEIEGEIAYDSIGRREGTLHGNPIWQPEGGMVDGAIELDGIDDYISTPYVVNPARKNFSVFAWIKGGAPGQVIVSQRDRANWLLADPTDGALRTDFRTPERTSRGGTIPSGPPLISSTVITDDEWHQVGFVWDGSYRTLYVDDVEVASDTQADLASSTGGLYIGAGKALEAGSFWSGLIDDVRIYNRAVTP